MTGQAGGRGVRAHRRGIRRDGKSHGGPGSQSWATHVPLLNFLKTSAQEAPSMARRFATRLRTHSSTQPLGRTYFQRSGFLLPIVVSSVT